MNILQRIQNLVMSVDSFGFAMYDLKGGGRIECDTEALEIGSIVSLVTDEGKELAPEGRHELQDGRTIVLDGSSKVTEIKEADVPTAAEIEAKREEDMKKEEMKKNLYMKKKSSSEMAMEMDPELISAVAEIIKKTSTELSEEDTDSLANELIKAIVAYTEDSEEMKKQEMEKDKMEKDQMKIIKDKMSELSSIVLEMAKSQEKFSADFKKLPSAKAISEIQFSSEPEIIDPIALRIKALQNLNK